MNSEEQLRLAEEAYKAAKDAHERLSMDESIAWYDRALEVLRKFPEGETRWEKEVLFRLGLGGVYEHMLRFPDALNAYGEAKNVAQRLSEESPSYGRGLTTAVLLALIQLHIGLGEYEQAHEYCQEYLPLVDEIEAPDEVIGRTRALGYQMLGQVHGHLGEYDTALEYLEKAYAISESISDSDRLFGLLIDIGNTYWRMQDYEAAIEALERAKKEADSRYQENRDLYSTRQLASICGNLGRCYSSAGHFEGAIDHYESALTLWKQVQRPKDMTMSYKGIATTYARTGQYDKALENLLSAAEIEKELGDAIALAETYQVLSQVSECLGRHREAIVYAEQSIQYLETVEAESDLLAEMYVDLGARYQQLSEQAKAIKCYERALQVTPQIDDTLAAAIYAALSVLYEEQRDYAKAQEYRQRAGELRRRLGLAAMFGMPSGLQDQMGL
jgi:tetratricopeptide (TPR) repeat protein